MIETDEAPRKDIDPALLRRVLGDALPSLLACGETRLIDVEPNGFATQAGSWFVTVAMPHGPRRALFVKHSDGTSDGASREVLVHRELFSRSSLPVTRFLGAVEASEGTFIVMERADGWDLRYHDLSIWEEAVRALAGLHAAFAAETSRLAECEYLVRYGAAQSIERLEVAAAVVARTVPAAADGMQRVAQGYASLAERLDELPATLVHGDLAPKNVIATAVRTPRIAFADWEWAGVGSGLIDLLELLNGLEGPPFASLAAVYLESVRLTGLVAPLPAEQRAQLDLVKLERTIFRLSRSEGWGVEGAQVERWVREGTALVQRLASSA